MLQNDEKLFELQSLFNIVFYKNRKYNGYLNTLNNRDIMTEIKLYKGDKSFSINKKKIYLCLLDENGEYYSNNTLIYVLAHEIAHCVNKEDIGHTENFENIFNEILELLTIEGIFNPEIPIPLSYCTYND